MNIPDTDTPTPEAVAALAAQIAAAVARVQRVERRVTWLETQVQIQRRSAGSEGPHDS